MQYHFLNILVVVLPFVGFVSAWVRQNGKCEAPPVGWGVIGNCSPPDDSECITSTTIPKTCPGCTFHSAWAGEFKDCICWFICGPRS
ncbi:hypothetical protein PTMSG1_03611 [Pyrenophora teres f. maculata]|nr:hypothetical protein PTMSG1_03611 [Pyrenophora teres f. maculata]